jgi:hypothetical protein
VLRCCDCTSLSLFSNIIIIIAHSLEIFVSFFFFFFFFFFNFFKKIFSDLFFPMELVDSKEGLECIDDDWVVVVAGEKDDVFFGIEIQTPPMRETSFGFKDLSSCPFFVVDAPFMFYGKHRVLFEGQVLSSFFE